MFQLFYVLFFFLISPVLSYFFLQNLPLTYVSLFLKEWREKHRITMISFYNFLLQVTAYFEIPSIYSITFIITYPKLKNKIHKTEKTFTYKYIHIHLYVSICSLHISFHISNMKIFFLC